VNSIGKTAKPTFIEVRKRVLKALVQDNPIIQSLKADENISPALVTALEDVRKQSNTGVPAGKVLASVNSLNKYYRKILKFINTSRQEATSNIV